MEKTCICVTLFCLHGLLLSGQSFPDSIGTFQILFDRMTGDSTVACYRIPALATAPNGRLIAVIDQRMESCADLNANNDINIVMRHSDDDGQTWSAIEKIVDYPLGISASDPSIIIDQITGKIFLFFNYMDLNKEKNVYYCYVTKSADNGKTWGKPVDITAQITPNEWHPDFKFITSGKGIQTRSGTLLHCLVHLQKGVFVFGSADHGNTWFMKNTPVIPADESKIVELSDGSWMINSRVNKKGMRYVHRSIDAGNSWITNPEPALPDPGCNASILCAPAVNGSDKNCLLFCNANSGKERKNLTIRTSFDEGHSWSEGKTIYPNSAAYSDMTILANGDIGVLFEKDDYTQNVFIRVKRGWLIN